MNHYILKEMEHGILMREIRSHYDPIYRYDQFGMNEPQPLAYNNFMFVFICLGMGIITSLTLALYEKIHAVGIDTAMRRVNIMRFRQIVLANHLQCGLALERGRNFSLK